MILPPNPNLFMTQALPVTSYILNTHLMAAMGLCERDNWGDEVKLLLLPSTVVLANAECALLLPLLPTAIIDADEWFTEVSTQLHMAWHSCVQNYISLLDWQSQ